MYDAFLNKGLQGSVDRNPVETLTTHLFNIGMSQSTICMMKKLQDLSSAVGKT